MNATAAKEAAEAAFKPAPKQEEKPAPRLKVDVSAMSDAEFERWQIEFHNEAIRRKEAKRDELEKDARIAWERDKDDALKAIKHIYEMGGCREHFVEFASKANGAFSPDLLFERSMPVNYLPAELRPEGVTVVKKGRTGSAGARSALSAPPPTHGDGNVPVEDVIVRVVAEKKGQPLTLEDVIFELSKDSILGAYLKLEPRGLSRKIGGVAKRGLIKKTDDGKYVPA